MKWRFSLVPLLATFVRSGEMSASCLCSTRCLSASVLFFFIYSAAAAAAVRHLTAVQHATFFSLPSSSLSPFATLTHVRFV